MIHSYWSHKATHIKKSNVFSSKSTTISFMPTNYLTEKSRPAFDHLSATVFTNIPVSWSSSLNVIYR